MSLFKSTKHAEFCPECQSPLQIKRGKQGLFLGCSAYPACDYLKPLQQHSHIIKQLDEICPDCGAFLQLKQGHFGIFIGCSTYPDCHFTVQDEPPKQADIYCPECKTHRLVERVGRSGKPFYGCSNYPQCKFILANPPLAIPCPQCHYPLSSEKKQRGKSQRDKSQRDNLWLQCANRNCQHLFEQPDAPTEAETDSAAALSEHQAQEIALIAEKLRQGEVVAYPTEAVFGLGCDPQNEAAVRKLLALKQRPEEKGLILVAPHLDFLRPYIDESRLSEAEWQTFSTPREKAISWIMPAKADVPRYLTGKFDTIAVRICPVPGVAALCQAVGFALTSTSANLTTLPPCRTAEAVWQQFGQDFPVLNWQTGGNENPSEIRDIFTQHIFRQG